jgi:hypothetical protein
MSVPKLFLFVFVTPEDLEDFDEKVFEFDTKRVKKKSMNFALLLLLLLFFSKLLTYICPVRLAKLVIFLLFSSLSFSVVRLIAMFRWERPSTYPPTLRRTVKGSLVLAWTHWSPGWRHLFCHTSDMRELCGCVC